MTMLPSKFKTLSRAAIVALALGASAAAILPAQAQQGPAFNFNLDIPGGSMTFGQDGFDGGDGNDGYDTQMRPRHHGNHDGGGYNRRCLTNREIRRGIEAYGYDRVEIRRELPRDRVEVVGQYGNWLYSMRVDKCTGEADRVERMRRVQGGGFGLQFNYGN